MQDVFIIGAKGIGNCGGYETFLKKLIKTDKSLTDLVGNYKDSSIMGIIGNTIVNN